MLDDLSRAGRRLMGFCRTNLFKRLESSGHAFLLSLERHVLRNFIFLHAIENNLPLPIGTTDGGLLDSHSFDEDADQTVGSIFDTQEEVENREPENSSILRAEADFRSRAAVLYAQYSEQYANRFRWLGSRHFAKSLRRDLMGDATALRRIVVTFGEWDPSNDAKLGALEELLLHTHPDQKVIVFSQFADTVRYLASELKARGVSKLEPVTGDTPDPTILAWRFSPKSNGKVSETMSAGELRVLVATDVLSEGQNLQDCAIVVNYDLPWAIIRLIQRAGRVDRIGQQADEILCYSFLPVNGVERLIRLRARIRTRLHENAEVVGTDEAFFENEDERAVLDLYSEKAGILDGDEETDVDLSSYAYQIWHNATEVDPPLKKKIESMPPVVYSSKAHKSDPNRPEGVLVYMRTAHEYDALAWLDRDGHSITESQFEILRMAECVPNTPALPRHETHHGLVRQAADQLLIEQEHVGGQLGRPSGARFRVYERLKHFAQEVEGTLFATDELYRTIDQIHRYPLRQVAVDILNRQIRSGISDPHLAELVMRLRDDDRLCIVHEQKERQEPKIICSMGLIGHNVS